MVLATRRDAGARISCLSRTRGTNVSLDSRSRYIAAKRPSRARERVARDRSCSSEIDGTPPRVLNAKSSKRSFSRGTLYFTSTSADDDDCRLKFHKKTFCIHIFYHWDTYKFLSIFQIYLCFFSRAALSSERVAQNYLKRKRVFIL